MATVDETEILLYWRALRHFRSGKRPACAPKRGPAVSVCPLFDACPRWHGQPDDYTATLGETIEQTDRRRAGWPCTRLLDLLNPDVRYIGRSRPS
jgi:hypothetical protein